MMDMSSVMGKPEISGAAACPQADEEEEEVDETGVEPNDIDLLMIQAELMPSSGDGIKSRGAASISRLFKAIEAGKVENTERALKEMKRIGFVFRLGYV
ncbi:hypothetical protein DVH24_010280 [Malus domestica]|uniref:Uncharacterized protein n=1 Tax=Malus domestica TaxID=3750 RepID=A0A498JRZ1_MALDO|nr:hypothetical protein DVH24_010280 [Malus domestica]